MDLISYTLAKKANDQLKAQNKKTETITHGMYILNALSDIASSLKVEFHGQTLINLLGKDGNAEDLSKFSFITGTGSIDTVDKKYGNSSVQATSNGSGFTQIKLNPKAKIDSTKYYIVLVDIKNLNNANSWASVINGTTGTSIKSSQQAIVNDWKLHYIKLSPTDLAGVTEVSVIAVGGVSATGQKLNADGFRIYEISADTYNKIGVSLLDADVERMFPYVSGISYVKNPVITASGKNLFNKNTVNIGKFVHRGTGGLFDQSNCYASDYISVLPSTDYVCNINPFPSSSGGFAFYDKDKVYISGIVANNKFTTPLNARYVRLTIPDVGNTVNWATTDINIVQLEIGSIQTPYVPYNPSYLYAETTIAGIEGGKKDILFRNFDKNIWQKTKWWEVNKYLDGLLDWEFGGDEVGYKVMRTTTLLSGMGTSYSPSAYLLKFDGKFMTNISDYATQKTSDIFYTYADGKPRITISDIDSGWLDAWSTTPPTGLTWNNLIKAYFNGWKYTGDGTIHSWKSLIDNSVPATNTIDYVKANMATGFTPYKITYQLTSPETIDLDKGEVVGDLKVNGATQVTVGSEFTYTEDPTTKKRTYLLTPSTSRTGANLIEVKCEYDSSLKSATDSMGDKLNGVAETVSVHDMQIYRMLLAMKNNNWTV